MEPHAEFLELCALATTGELSKEEQKRLEKHLAGCCECRRALREFEAAVEEGVPLLFQELSKETLEAVDDAMPERCPSEDVNRANVAERQHGMGIARRDGRRHAPANWNLAWLPLTAAVLLAVALGVYSYEVGMHRGQEAVTVTRRTADARVEVLEQQISDVGYEREILKAQLAERKRTIAELQHQVQEQSATLREIKSAQAKLAQSLQSDEAEKQQVAQEHNNLLQKVDVVQASLQKAQEELDALQQQHSRDQLVAESLEVQISDLGVQLREREETVGKQEELLAHDRDIRELIGARDLYIAEVYDVAADGKTQKPYGRAFYTKGKSLIFYAYDLDRETEAKKASTFQAWGQHGPDRQQALNLGIFYEDRAGKKRWVLKFDDAKALAQIDAVFVTVEPSGGSLHPSGKPLLYAYLNTSPNYP